jgi:hypothetical protein
LIDCPAITADVKAKLSAQYRLYNPLVLQHTVHKAVNLLLTAHGAKLPFLFEASTSQCYFSQ